MPVTSLHQEAEVSLVAGRFLLFRPTHQDKRNQILIQMSTAFQQIYKPYAAT